MGMSIWQLLIIGVIVVVLFGTKKLRNIGGDLGAAVKGFKNAMNDDDPKKNNDASSDEVFKQQALDVEEIKKENSEIKTEEKTEQR